jgi:hypothetical protein
VAAVRVHTAPQARCLPSAAAGHPSGVDRVTTGRIEAAVLAVLTTQGQESATVAATSGLAPPAVGAALVRLRRKGLARCVHEGNRFLWSRG